MMELFDTINWSIIAPILIIQGILIVVALIDLKKVDKTAGPKWMWIFIIVFINIVGPIVYFIIGRSDR